MDSRKAKGKEHYVFDSVQEFEEYFLREHGVVPELAEAWRDAEEGTWVVADDGGVCQILRRSPLPHHGDRKNYKTHKGYVRTIVGTFFQNKKTFMDVDFSRHPNRFRFGGATDAEYLKKRRTRKELSNPEVIFTAAVCSGKTIQQAYEESFGPHEDWYRRAIFLLKRERIMTRIRENVKDKLDDKFGGDVLEFIFEELKKLIVDTDNDSVKLSALKDLGDWSGEKEKTKQITKGEITVFQPFTGGELAKIEATEVKVLDEVKDE